MSEVMGRATNEAADTTTGAGTASDRAPDSGAATDSATAATLADLFGYLDASPTPYHAVAEGVLRLTAAGFTELAETERFPAEPGRYVLVRDGALVAWDSRGLARGAAQDRPSLARNGFRIIGAHTDSPNLRVKPHPDLARAGWRQLAVEPYGGLLRSSWLDRDLGLAGRVALREHSGGVRTVLFRDARPLLRVPQLAIHLDRSANDGLTLNPQEHLNPVWGLGDTPGDFAGYLAEQVGCAPGDVLAWDAMAFPVEAPSVLGADGELFAAARLDNQVSCHAGLTAILAAAHADADAGADAHSDADAGTPQASAQVPVLVLFDHEEIGSSARAGAQSTLLPSVLERVVVAAGGDREDVHAALAASLVASADMAHATHPAYPERHDPTHQVRPGGGPVLKVNVNQRYATDAPGAAAFALACEQAGVPMQVFVSRSDQPCGSTIGPMTAARTGVRTVDIGAPMLSMHSARELAAVADIPRYVDAVTAFLAPQ